MRRLKTISNADMAGTQAPNLLSSRENGMRNIVVALVFFFVSTAAADARNGTLIAPPNASPAVNAPYSITERLSDTVKRLGTKNKVVDECGHYCKTSGDCGNGCDCNHGSLCGTGYSPDTHDEGI
jgi:hypothetical protein